MSGTKRLEPTSDHPGDAPLAWLASPVRRPLSACLRGSTSLRRWYWRAQSTLRLDRRSLAALPAQRIIVMMFHRIRTDANRFWPGLDPEVFAGVLRALRSRVDFVTTAEIGSRRGSSRPAALVTIDDGYRDGLELAAPILRQLGIPAVYNVVPTAIASGRPPNPLAELLQRAPGHLVSQLRVSGFEGSLAEAPTPGHYYASLSSFLEAAPPGQQVRILDAIEDTLGSPSRAEDLMLTAADVAALGADFEIGCNGYDHRSMMGRSAEDLMLDIEQSRDFFRDHLGLPLTIYAFPRGSYHPAMVAVARRSGITTLLLGSGGIARESDYPLTRVPMWGDSVEEARCRAVGMAAGAGGVRPPQGQVE